MVQTAGQCRQTRRCRVQGHAVPGPGGRSVEPMATKIKFVDVLKSFDVPGIVPWEYQHEGVPMLAKLKTTAHALVCPQCGGLKPRPRAPARGLVFQTLHMRPRPAVQGESRSE